MSSTDNVAVGTLSTPVGTVSVAVTDVGLAALGWGEPGRLVRSVPVVEAPARVQPVIDQLSDYFRGERRVFDLTLDWRYTSGTSQAVLRTLYDTVLYGQSITYGGLAERSRTGVPARGIGSVMGSNPLPIVVPCHRVLAHDGLGGYSGGSGRDGLEVKRWLLTMEGALPPTLDWDPTRL